MNYKLDFTPVIDGLPNLLLGCLGTFLLAICGMLLAIVIGIGGVALRDSALKPARWLVIAFVELIRNTPFLVQIFFIYFALPLTGIRLDPTPTAIIALGINGGAYAIEIIRGGVQSIPKGQMEAGLGPWSAQGSGLPADHSQAGIAGNLSVFDQPVRPVDADHQHCIGDLGLRADVRFAAHRIGELPQLRGLLHRHGFLFRDLLADDAHLRAVFGALLQISGQVGGIPWVKKNSSSS
ncbi:His/Glu/Gln/Arg/opine family amino acid ABC transporter permease subunit [Rhizobium brockwellii]